jgi:hypothetical protein
VRFREGYRYYLVSFSIITCNSILTSIPIQLSEDIVRYIDKKIDTYQNSTQ